MKKSDKLDEEARRLEDDNQAWRLHGKAKRERRKENFLENELKKLKEKYDCTYMHPGDVCQIRGTKHGFIDYWPKSDTVRIRSKNKYIKRNGLNWIKKELL